VDFTNQTIKRLLLCLTIIFPAIITPSFAQYKSEQEASIPLEHFYIQRRGNGILRPWLSKLHWSLSTGYGNTPFRHKLDGYGIIQNADSLPKIFSDTNSSVVFGQWVRDIAPAYPAAAGAFAVSSDTADLGFRSSTLSIPFKATVHIEFDRYRIGGGYSMDYTRIGVFRPISYGDNISSFKLDNSSFFMKHYFGMIGASVYRYYEYVLVVDANIGGYKLGKQFNQGLISRSIYFNLGATMEREFSEYFRVFVRPSYEIKNYKLASAEGGQEIKHRINGFYVNVGVTYRLPELRRCYNKQCRAQINHVHGNREYRSRVHPFYKKQNPHHGENYPTLIKYKGKNKDKLNPY
jgi:hypothetical protein